MGVPPIKTFQGGWVGNDWIASHEAGNGILRSPSASLRASVQNDRGVAVGWQHKGHCDPDIPGKVIPTPHDIPPPGLPRCARNDKWEAPLVMVGIYQLSETADIVLINPLYPPILGVFYIWGTPPDPRQKVSCTSFSAVSIYLHEIIHNCPEGQGLLL